VIGIPPQLEARVLPHDVVRLLLGHGTNVPRRAVAR
jgi:hypothetical protein